MKNSPSLGKQNYYLLLLGECFARKCVYKKYVGLPSMLSFLVSALIVVLISAIVIRVQKASHWKWVR